MESLNLNLTKSFYTLRLLKTRDLKIKLLHVVNYFRAVQRILAMDLKEFVTREKSLGDQPDTIGPHFGKDSNGVLLSKKASPNGPGMIFQTHVQRDLDSREKRDKDDKIDTITLKGYKF